MGGRDAVTNGSAHGLHQRLGRRLPFAESLAQAEDEDALCRCAHAPGAGHPARRPGRGGLKAVGQWVQCDRCDKWRYLKIDPIQAARLPNRWFCELNPDPKRNQCSHPEETAEDEDEEWEYGETAPAAGARRQRRRRRRRWSQSGRPSSAQDEIAVFLASGAPPTTLPRR